MFSFIGTSSKKVWERRIDGDKQYVKLQPETEIWYYMMYHLRPYLYGLCEPGFRYIIYLAAKVEFTKSLGKNEKW